MESSELKIEKLNVFLSNAECENEDAYIEATWTMSDVQVKNEINLEHSFAEGLQKLIFPTGHIWFNLGQNKIYQYIE